jgi:hypothetical protein
MWPCHNAQPQPGSPIQSNLNAGEGEAEAADSKRLASLHVSGTGILPIQYQWGDWARRAKDSTVAFSAQTLKPQSHIAPQFQTSPRRSPSLHKLPPPPRRSSRLQPWRSPPSRAAARTGYATAPSPLPPWSDPPADDFGGLRS